MRDKLFELWVDRGEGHGGYSMSGTFEEVVEAIKEELIVSEVVKFRLEPVRDEEDSDEVELPPQEELPDDLERLNAEQTAIMSRCLAEGIPVLSSISEVVEDLERNLQLQGHDVTRFKVVWDRQGIWPEYASDGTHLWYYHVQEDTWYEQTDLSDD